MRNYPQITEFLESSPISFDAFKHSTDTTFTHAEALGLAETLREALDNIPNDYDEQIAYLIEFIGNAPLKIVPQENNPYSLRSKHATTQELTLDHPHNGLNKAIRDHMNSFLNNLAWYQQEAFLPWTLQTGTKPKLVSMNYLLLYLFLFSEVDMVQRYIEIARNDFDTVVIQRRFTLRELQSYRHAILNQHGDKLETHADAMLKAFQLFAKPIVTVLTHEYTSLSFAYARKNPVIKWANHQTFLQSKIGEYESLDTVDESELYFIAQEDPRPDLNVVLTLNTLAFQNAIHIGYPFVLPFFTIYSEDNSFQKWYLQNLEKDMEKTWIDEHHNVEHDYYKSQPSNYMSSQLEQYLDRNNQLPEHPRNVISI